MAKSLCKQQQALPQGWDDQLQVIHSLLQEQSTKLTTLHGIVEQLLEWQDDIIAALELDTVDDDFSDEESDDTNGLTQAESDDE